MLNGAVLPLNSLFSFTDVEGDNLETVTFQDNSFDVAADPANGIEAVQTGFFRVNGARQAEGVPITVPFSQINTVVYVASPTASSVGEGEDFSISVNDFLNESNVGVGTIRTVERPVIVGVENDTRLDTIERVFITDLVAQIDDSELTRYQVFDENFDPRSGRFELDGVSLQNGVVHDLTAAQYDRLQVLGAEVDFGRQFDPILVRANDGTGFSEWTRVNVNTDPVAEDALDAGVQLLDDAGMPERGVVTYSFIDGGNQGGGSNAGAQIPAYYFDIVPIRDEVIAEGQNRVRALSQEQRETYREVFDFVERVTELDLVELPYTSINTQAEIIIGSYAFIPPFGDAITNLPDTGNGIGNIESDIFFNTAFNINDGNVNFNPDDPTDVSLGSDFRDTAYAQVARALGLDFPFAGEFQLSIFNNFDYLTVTASQHDSVFNRFDAYPELPSSFALYDIAQLQALYGANTEFNSGDNQYGNFFSGSAPHFVNNDEQHQSTLWDPSGNDTLNYTLHVADETIDLRQGTFSSINGVPQSLRISYNTVIENARGGSGDDNIRGNETRNFLIANGGDDVLRGGGGNDVMRGGAGNDTYIWSLGDGRDLVQEFGGGGLDTLEVFDPSGSLTSLQDDLTFRRFGNDLRIDFTFNQGAGQGTVTIDDFGDEVSRVEFLEIHNSAGTQIGETIDLQSIFDQATTLAQRFSVTTELATTLPVEDGAANQNAFVAIAVG